MGESVQTALFEGMPERLVSECVKRPDGVTLRDKKGRTVRHKPWWMLLGKGPQLKTCGDCQSLEHHNRYLKCGRQIVTAGPGTDIRKKDMTCRLFKERAT